MTCIAHGLGPEAYLGGDARAARICSHLLEGLVQIDPMGKEHRPAVDVRGAPVVLPGIDMGPGGTSTVEMHLSPGRWLLEFAYASRLPVTVSAPNLHVTLPASLDRPGPRWPVGQMTVRGGGPTKIVVTTPNPLLAPGILLTEIFSFVATPTRKPVNANVNSFTRSTEIPESVAACGLLPTA